MSDQPNLNTFAPTPNVAAGKINNLPVLTKGDSVLIAGAGAFGGWSA